MELSRQQLAYSPSRKCCTGRELVTDIFKLNLEKSGLFFFSKKSVWTCRVWWEKAWSLSPDTVSSLGHSFTDIYIPLSYQALCSGSEWQHQVRNFTATTACKVGRWKGYYCLVAGGVARLRLELRSSDFLSFIGGKPHCHVVSMSSGCCRLIRPCTDRLMLTDVLNVSPDIQD